MGRHVGRSRGCRICRQRKIKCDEKTPECSQCLKAHKTCPGPLQGPLFLNAIVDRGKPIARDITSLRRKRNSNVSQARSKILEKHPIQETDSLAPSGYSHRHSKSNTTDYGGNSAEFRIPAQHSISRSPAFQELFLDHFINAFFDPRCERHRASEWSIALSSFLQGHEQTASIVYAIRAATMAHYGKISGDVSIQNNSMLWYLRGLETQQIENCETQQKLTVAGDTSSVLSDSVIATPLMFSLFETVMGTTSSAWVHHLSAASHMLETLGPWKCQEGILHHMFKVARVGAVYIGLLNSAESVFASDSWCTIPFLQKKKTTSDWLNDILLKLPECMALRLKLRDARMNGSQLEQPLTKALESKSQWLLIRFQEYWKEHGDEVDPTYQWEIYREASNFQTIAEEWNVASSQAVRFHSKFAARIIAEYDAGKAILCSILREVYIDRVDEYQRSVVIHCASILEAVYFLSSLGVESGGNTSLVFPLRTISQCTPSQEQKIKSRLELEKWGRTRGVEGVIRMPGDTV